MLLYQGVDPAKQGVFFWAVSSTEESTNLDVLNLAVRQFGRVSGEVHGEHP